ncbi:hypothetical protein [Chryseobacterium camelliae]|nr:hypothetical protein [Chryseobacterium camelliae]MDR6514448.1 hypothetical protein [Chryseobacterium camelliae]
MKRDLDFRNTEIRDYQSHVVKLYALSDQILPHFYPINISQY